MKELGSNFSLRHLSAFMATLAQGRIAGASRQIRRSSSAISRSITILEDRFGRPLLARSQGGLTPTPEGALVAERCKIIGEELSALQDLLRRSNNRALGHENASFFRMQFDVSHLRALVTVHDFGSVQRASQLLGVSQPAVSSSIRYLEADLGLELFSRTPKGMIATPAGVSGAICAKRVLAELRKMNDDIASIDGVSSGLVCVGGLAYSRKTLLPEAIKRILSDFPGIVVRTVEGPIRALIVAMHAGEIDMLICARPDPALLEGVSVEPIVDDAMGLFVSSDHPLARRKKLIPEDLLEWSFILPPIGSTTRNLLDDIFESATGRRPQGAVETSSYSLIGKLLLSSNQISFRSMSEFEEEMRTGQVVPLDLAFALPTRSICLLQRRRVKTTPAVDDFLATVREVAAQRSAADRERSSGLNSR